MSIQFERGRSAFAAVGAAAIIFGAGVAFFNMLSWYYAQASLSLFDQTTKLLMVSRFFLAEGLATAMIVTGTYLVYRALLRLGLGSGPFTIRSIMSEALASGRSRKIGLLASVTYAVVYAFASSILVYQPGVDFGQVYGVSATSWNAAACCGNPGTVPSLVVYLLPQAHLALQLVPLNILFVIVIPFLVGFNVAVASHALGKGPAQRRGKWVGSIGVLTGLFTACPTCAGLFLASAVGGVGATTLAVALAPYQLIFILVSIPLLLASPLIVAASVRGSMLAACDLKP